MSNLKQIQTPPGEIVKFTKDSDTPSKSVKFTTESDTPSESVNKFTTDEDTPSESVGKLGTATVVVVDVEKEDGNVYKFSHADAERDTARNGVETIDGNGSQTNDNPETRENSKVKSRTCDNNWNPPDRKATKNEEKSMFAEVLAIVVKILMNNHIYSFGGGLRIQEGNGSIGDRATGIIAQIVMIWWDRMFQKKLNDLQIVWDVIKRFIDDINGVFGVLEPGTEYNNGVLSVNPLKIESDRNTSDDERTMNVNKEIANGIGDMIVMTVDVPLKYEDSKLLVLDMKVWLSEEDKIFLNFYEKLIKN